MIEIGKYNDLRVNRFVDFGLYLIDDEANEVLLPKRYLTGEEQIDDMLHVFVYNDSENRPVATTETPYAVVGDFALMRVNQPGGCFPRLGVGEQGIAGAIPWAACAYASWS